MQGELSDWKAFWLGSRCKRLETEFFIFALVHLVGAPLTASEIRFPLFQGCMWTLVTWKGLCMSHISLLIYMRVAFLSLISVPHFTPSVKHFLLQK